MLPTVTVGKRFYGVAGQFGYTASVKYPGESAAPVTLVGTAYGNSVVFISASSPGGIHVVDPEKYGELLSPAWIRNFFGPRDVEGIEVAR